MPKKAMTKAQREELVEQNRVIKNAQKYREDGIKRAYYCFSCNRSFPKREGNFTLSPHPMFRGNLGFVHICNSCMRHYESEYFDLFECDSDKTIKHLAGYFGWYVGDTMLNMAKPSSKNNSRFTSVAAKHGLTQFIGKTYDNYIVELRDKIEYEKENGIPEKEDNEELAMEEIVAEIRNAPKITRKMIKFWGTGYTPEELIFLNDKYDEWTSRHECKTKAQESLFQKICLMELQISKAMQTETKGNEISSLMKAFNDLLGSANIKPVQSKENQLVEKNTLGTLIQKWENDKPIPEPDPMFKDVDGIGHLIKAWFLAPLCRMFGISNSYTETAEIEEEVSKYTIEPPRFIDDDTPVVDIFANITNSQGDSAEDDDIAINNMDGEIGNVE